MAIAVVTPPQTPSLATHYHQYHHYHHYHHYHQHHHHRRPVQAVWEAPLQEARHHPPRRPRGSRDRSSVALQRKQGPVLEEDLPEDDKNK